MEDQSLVLPPPAIERRSPPNDQLSSGRRPSELESQKPTRRRPSSAAPGSAGLDAGCQFRCFQFSCCDGIVLCGTGCGRRLHEDLFDVGEPNKAKDLSKVGALGIVAFSAASRAIGTAARMDGDPRLPRVNPV